MKSICHDCAKKKKLQWPKGHVATQWYGTCGYCNKPDQPCCDDSDYDWPDKKPRGEREF